jgi:hypothetical protein
MAYLCAVVRTRAQPLTSVIVGLILAMPIWTHVKTEKSLSTLCRKSWIFYGYSGVLPQEKLTEWVKINTVRKVISQTKVVKINSLG